MLAEIVPLSRAFWDVCLLRRRPQDLPNSGFLLNTVVALYFALGLLLNLFGLSFVEAVVLSAAMTGLLIVTIHTLLMLRGHRERARQTITALMGAAIVLFLPALALRYWFYVIETAGTQSRLAAYVWIFLFVWESFIAAHVLRHALNLRLIFAYFIAIAYILLEFQVLIALHTALGRWLAPA